jgi:hypothetical protein
MDFQPSNMKPTYVAPDAVAQSKPLDDDHVFDMVGAPHQVKQTIVGPSARARDAATGDPLPNQQHADLVGRIIPGEKNARSFAAGLRALSRTASQVRLGLSVEEYRQHEEIIKVINDDNLTAAEKLDAIERMDPDKKFIRLAIERGEQDIRERQTDLDKQDKLIRSLEVYRDWEYAETAKYRLQKNECSRLHKLREAMDNGMFYDAAEKKFLWTDPLNDGMKDAKVFVVRHDWAAAFGADSDFFNPAHPFKLPYPKCAFEFRIDSHTVIMILDENVGGNHPVGCVLMFEGIDGIWFSFGPDDPGAVDIAAACERQVRAICVALEAHVAEHEVVRAPAKLNAKRAKEGRTPLYDYHVVDLSRRIKARSRAEARPDAQPTGRHVRMHWRRGHWRHYETHTTWIEWMLVGDPDLGFIDKEYRL